MATNETQILDILDRQRAFFKTGATRSYHYRIGQLKKLKQAIKTYEGRFQQALRQDLGKCEFEAYATETGFVRHDLSFTIASLKKWMAPRRIKTPYYLQPAKSWIQYDPLGMNLIIAPFNYPMGLTFTPVIAAMAAGNTAVIKTSELTPHTSAVIKTLISDVFDSRILAYIEGDISETTLLLKQKFDHIFFTGSPRVGSIVMENAARHLTPVTLELGGKSPCIVHSDARLEIAVKRIVYGKFINAGQTCIAPDYVLVHKDIKPIFLEKLKTRIIDIYGKDAALSPDFGRMVNDSHFDRVAGLIDSEKVFLGGNTDKPTRFIAPTVMTDITLEDPVMKEEIFGPILPVMTYEHEDDVIEIVSRLPQHPLACYIFSETPSFWQALLSKIQFGGGCINHCIQHMVNPNLPFGGTGQSGMGNYHGFNGFETFSHKKSVLKAATWFDLRLLYPPYGKKTDMIRKILK